MAKAGLWRADWVLGIVATLTLLSALLLIFRSRMNHLSGRRTDGAAGAAPATLGNYRIDKELARGAMGLIYLGHDTLSGRAAAIKILGLPEARDDFFREAEVIGRLRHPSIPEIYGTGEEGGVAYIAMELLQGTDLVPHVRRGSLLPLPKALGIVARVAEALDCAHRHGIVHGDIKPANIMYDAESGRVKLADFGLAGVADASRIKAGAVLGTPAYMAPEQLTGEGIDGRSDLYSLGVVLYQLCCGRLPFAGDSVAELMFNIAHEPPFDILATNPDLPSAVAAIVAKAIQKAPEQRYRSGTEFAEAILAWLKENDDRPAAAADGWS